MLNISSTSNAKIVELLHLRNKKDRYLKGKFLVEGYHLVEEAKKHHLLEMIVTTNKEDFDKYQIDGYLVNENIIQKLSTTVNAQPIVGVVSLKEENLEEKLKTFNSFVLLDNINDPGNFGTIIRTCAALGIDAIIASSDTVDLYNDKVIRATQGSIFKIPIFKTSIQYAVQLLQKNNIPIFATSLNALVDIKEVKKPSQFGIIFGNEANGVQAEILNQVDYTFKINMKKDVESLNVAIACGIVVYAFTNGE